ncbi:MAG: peptidoglycan DD-metalloendopeptidase family protein [Desulforhopalus sp.]|nr:peptidoglycan DD-metalloendopeptidase family protein [Desulforhopalus sp.]
MDEQLHIIVAGDRGKVFKLPCSKKKLCIALTASAVAFLILTITSICSFSLYTRNCEISNQLAGLQEKLLTNDEQIAQYNRLTEEQQLKLRLTEEQQLELDQKVARLEQNNIKQATAFKEEKENLISTAVDELNERSQLLERVFSNIGIKLKPNKDDNSKHSGGPFIQHPDAEMDEILFKADKYLNTIRYLPFGRPVKGPITSKYGKRRDPINKKSAFHSGIDFRGKTGEQIHATADGVVKKAFRNGGYGNYLLIDHGNGYTTSFSHMQKYLVHKGDKVKRGQLIGLVGNSGRSTGSHLHYEIAVDNKTINPYNFLQAARFAKKPTLHRRLTK